MELFLPLMGRIQARGGCGALPVREVPCLHRATAIILSCYAQVAKERDTGNSLAFASLTRKRAAKAAIIKSDFRRHAARGAENHSH